MSPLPATRAALPEDTAPSPGQSGTGQSLLAAGDTVRLSYTCHMVLKTQRERRFRVVLRAGCETVVMQVLLLGALSLVHTRALLIGDPHVPWRGPLPLAAAAAILPQE